MNANKSVALNGHFLILLAPLVILSSCTRTQNTSDLKAVLYLGVAYDVSGSVAERELPVLTTADIEQLIAIVETRGGEIALGLIDERAFQPLLRSGELVSVTGRLDERARRRVKNQRALHEFRSKAEAKIRRPRDAEYTDINGAISRFSLFFGEPTADDNAEKIMLFVSDGIDTGPWKRLNFHFPNDVTIFVVGMEPGFAQTRFASRALLFESMTAVLQAIKTASEKGVE